MIRHLILLLSLVLLATPAPAQSVRVRDLVDFDGVRGNDLVGYGLVVGLDGSGDSLRNEPFTEEILSNVLERLGVNVTGEQLRSRNVAAVFVTAELQPFARAGSRIDLTVSAIGDATSLLGGTLVMTPLKAADGLIYAVGQGTVIAGGARAEGQAAEVVEGVPTSGAIPSGARVEREVPFVFNDLHSIRLALRNPDFTTAERIERAINAAYGARVSQMLDSGTVLLDVRATREPTPAHAIGRIENLTVEPQVMARVVVDQRSGTIVMGQDVRISRVAVSQGGLVLRVEERPEVVQPNPFAQGRTVVVPRTVAELGQEPGAGFIELAAETSLREVIDGLNALGVAPQDMIDILQTINAAGALHAEFVVR